MLLFTSFFKFIFAFLPCIECLCLFRQKLLLLLMLLVFSAIHTHSSVTCLDNVLGEVKLKGIAAKQTLYQLADGFLSARVFSNDYGQGGEQVTALEKAADGKQICNNCSRPLVCKHCAGAKSGLKGNRVGSIMPRQSTTTSSRQMSAGSFR